MYSVVTFPYDIAPVLNCMVREWSYEVLIILLLLSFGCCCCLVVFVCLFWPGLVFVCFLLGVGVRELYDI